MLHEGQYYFNFPALVGMLISPGGGGGWEWGRVYLTKFHKGRIRRKVQPLTLLYTLFSQHLLLTNGTPFKNLV